MINLIYKISFLSPLFVDHETITYSNGVMYARCKITGRSLCWFQQKPGVLEKPSWRLVRKEEKKGVQL